MLFWYDNLQNNILDKMLSAFSRLFSFYIFMFFPIGRKIPQ